MSNLMRFGAVGDGETDDTEAIRHAVAEGDGMLHFPPGTYRITSTIEVKLTDQGPLGIDGTGGTARVVMAGKGPAFRLIGSHGGTGDPASRKGNVATHQRLPTIKNIEVEGAHPDADGFELFRTMQSVFEGVMVTRCRHGIHLIERNRNVVISHCHVYFNTGAGIYLDDVNLHQINITGSHISYNRQGGIRIESSEVRNLQITGNDIEYNNFRAHKTEPEPTAEIYVDVSAEGASVNEVTIASNTIQATESPGGANIRIKEKPDASRPPGLFAISGNVIGSQENNVHLTGCYGIALSGNTIYSCGHRNLLIEDSQLVNVSANTFRRHTPKYGTGVRFERSSDITFSGCAIHDESESGQPKLNALLELADCERINVTGNQFLNGIIGVDASNCTQVALSGNTIHDSRAKPIAKHAVTFSGKDTDHVVANNVIGKTSGKPLVGVIRASGNVVSGQ
ncbi:right-handed parallel beta-helix repeat-containing protein [Verrucomicrobia bacterium]|nr:right-handed parallel beta-helix repeat-containing protein [Verrucomicrobiota bacterium]